MKSAPWMTNQIKLDQSKFSPQPDKSYIEEPRELKLLFLNFGLNLDLKNKY